MELHDGFCACHAFFLYDLGRWTKDNGKKMEFF